MQILTIIALLCQMGTSEPRQIECQQSYIKCLKFKNAGKLRSSAPGTNDEEILAKCVEERKD